MLQVPTPRKGGGDSPENRTDLLIALGGNRRSAVGGPKKTLLSALDLLEKSGAAICALSRFYRTPAFPAGSGPSYVNAAALVRADWSIDTILPRLHQIESDLGRVRDVRWGPRTLDLDLIAAGDAVCPDALTHARWRELTLDTQMRDTPSDLILPHPRMQDRAFVLVPLSDIAPHWRHPILQQSVTQMLAALPTADVAGVEAME